MSVRLQNTLVAALVLFGGMPLPNRFSLSIRFEGNRSRAIRCVSRSPIAPWPLRPVRMGSGRSGFNHPRSGDPTPLKLTECSPLSCRMCWWVTFGSAQVSPTSSSDVGNVSPIRDRSPARRPNSWRADYGHQQSFAGPVASKQEARVNKCACRWTGCQLSSRWGAP